MPTSFALGLSGMMVMGLCFQRKSAVRVLAVIALLGVMLLAVSCGGSSPRTSAITLTTSASSATYGSPVVLKAQVTGSGATPSGDLVFLDAVNGQNFTLGSATLSNGAAQLTANNLLLGSHTISAVYNGDSAHPAATSSAVAVAVNYKANLKVTAVDASGYTVSAPLTVTIQ